MFHCGRYGLFCLVIFVIILLPPQSYASDLSNLIDESRVLELSSHHVWLKLIHYKADKSSVSGWSSEVNSKSFFLSPMGYLDPKEELLATLTAFTSYSVDAPNQHAQCLFRGRFVWLSSQLDFDDWKIPKVVCQDYLNWTDGEEIFSISLLFATGYLSNPASFYGHTLLKLNSKNKVHSSLLDVSLNYGAILPDAEGPISYVIKGVFGGYNAGFTNIKYYFHKRNYGELELRDIWEYELNLSKLQVDLIMGHLWELLGKKFTYYFLRQNCGYRMAEVLELIEGIKIIPTNHLWIFPQTIVKNLTQSNINGKPIVTKVKYHPSRQSLMYQRHKQLSYKEKKIVAKIVGNSDGFNLPEYRQSDVDSKKAILGVLYDYYKFQEVSNGGAGEGKPKKVLIERFQLPAGKVFVSEKGLGSLPPHLSRKPSFLQISGIANGKFNDGIAIRIRPSYYDSLDSGSGHIENSELKMFDTEFIYLDERFSLKKLDIFSVESVSVLKTRLPGDNGGSWRLKLGIELQNLACKDCLVARFQGDKGITKNIGNFLLGIQIGGVLQNKRHGLGVAYLRPSIFGNVRLSDEANFKFQIEKYINIDKSRDIVMSYNFEGRYSLAKDWDIRFRYQKNLSQELSLSLGYYW